MSVATEGASLDLEHREGSLVDDPGPPAMDDATKVVVNGEEAPVVSESPSNEGKQDESVEKTEVPDETQVIVPARTKRKHQGEGA